MKQYLITIDGGTTNTRVALWNEKKELQFAAKSEVGVKDTAREGSNDKLKKAVKTMIEEVMQCGGITYDEVDSIYACGMLTSNVGIQEVPHLTAPVSLEDYVQGVKEVVIPEICPIPIGFVPGMKNFSGEINIDNLEMMDIMRGEETETIALVSLYSEREALYVLPGSHTKFVSVNKDGKMTGCLTSIAGELLSLLTNQSILADAVKKQFASETYNREMLLAGGRQTWETGLPRAAFLTRIVNQFITDKQEECASFLLGTVLAEDIRAVKSSRALSVTKDMSVIIAGKEPLRSALKDLFLEDGTLPQVSVLSDEKNTLLSGYGMCIIAEERRKIQ